MKKTLFAISAIAVLLGFMACTSDEIVEPQVSGKTITISASTESNATRTALADDGEGGYDVVWSTGDAIRIGTETFTLTGEAGKTNGTFEGATLTDGTEYTAYYPTTYDGENWPTTQTYTEGNITGSPMTATFTYSEGTSLSFKNAGGILRLTVKGSANVTSIKVSATGLDPITLDCGTTGVALASEGTQFHIAMPAGEYSGVSITLTDDAGKVCVKKLSSTKNLVITRSNITPASFTASSFKPTITASSPVGTIGMLDGREGIVVDLGGTIGKVVVATMNVGATSVDYATAANNATCYGVQYDAAGANNLTAMGLTDGWKAPTPEELKALFDLGGSWRDADYTNNKAAGYVFTVGANELFLPAAGYNNYRLGDCCDYRSALGSTKDEWGMDSENISVKFHIWNEGMNWSTDNTGISNYYSVRPFHAMPAASKTYKVGDKVEFDGHEGIVVELGGKKVAVATMNVEATSVNGAGCRGSYLTYDEARAAIWSGWRLPTVDEMETLCSVDYPGVCGDTQEGEVGGTGAMMWDLDGNEEIDLYLPLNDYYFDGENSFPFDKYWTRTTKDGGNSYYYFAPEIDWEGDGENTYFPIDYDFREVYKEAVDKTDTNNKFLVRLFHKLPTE